MIRTTQEDATAHLGDLIDAALRGDDVFIAPSSGRGDRIIKLVVVPSHDQPPYRKAGSAMGTIRMADDFDEPLEDFMGYR
jgi:antitoxin (DNA-binding transcriptional repressor) of toxin-antitoxin stability system